MSTPTLNDSPPLMLVSPRALRREAVEGLRESLGRLRAGAGQIVVIDGGMEVYQLVDGRWRPLRGGGPIPEEDAELLRVRREAVAEVADAPRE